MKKNNGYITSKELDMFDIHRMYLSIMQEKEHKCNNKGKKRTRKIKNSCIN